MNYPQNNPEHPDQNLHVLDILNTMKKEGLATAFIYALMENCQRYEGMRDLMEMWAEETDFVERNKIIVDLQETLDDITASPRQSEERPYLRFDDFDEIRKDIAAFKKQLRGEVDRQGGICELERRTGIPQSSLSRFFSSHSMPRRTTLFKIAKALDLPETVIGFKWTT